MKSDPVNLGISLSGGGVRGVAHLGMLKALASWGISPEILTGTSSGAIIGALYSYGYSPGDILELVKKAKLRNILRPAFTMKGLLTLEKAYEYFNKLLPEDSFSSLKIPLTICATNVRTGQAGYFSEGTLIKPVMASCAIPVIFSPVEINGEYYIDGGVTENMPVKPLKGKCDRIVGMHCNPVDPDFDVRNMKHLLERTFILIINTNVEFSKPSCDLFLEPFLLKKFAALEFSNLDEIFNIGYQYALSREKEIRDLLA